jgi:hypothetical protein
MAVTVLACDIDKVGDATGALRVKIFDTESYRISLIEMSNFLDTQYVWFYWLKT